MWKCKQGCKRETKPQNHRDSVRSYKSTESWTQRLLKTCIELSLTRNTRLFETSLQTALRRVRADFGPTAEMVHLRRGSAQHGALKLVTKTQIRTVVKWFDSARPKVPMEMSFIVLLIGWWMSLRGQTPREEEGNANTRKLVFCGSAKVETLLDNKC